MTKANSTPGNPVGWFEIGTPDAATARRFYGDLFGWSFQDQDGYCFVSTGSTEGVQGGLVDTTGPVAPGTVATYAIPYVIVPDVAAAAARAVELGGKVAVAPQTTPDGLAFAQITDPTGALVGMFTPPAAA